MGNLLENAQFAECTFISTLIDILLFHEKHAYGKVRFFDKDGLLILQKDACDLGNIDPLFYHDRVEYRFLKPTDNPYPNEIVSTITFIDSSIPELRNRKYGGK
jgi:hypothetical protein